MPALFFPSLDTLRLVLASGVLPSNVTDAPATCAAEEQGRVWIVPAEPPSRDLLAKLARLGVRIHAEPGRPTTEQCCWAAVLPLRRVHVSSDASERILFDLPDRNLVRLASHLRRTARFPFGVLMGSDGRAWVAAVLPLYAAAEVGSTDGCFREQAPGLWVSIGWQHPVPERFAVPSGLAAVLRPDRPPQLLPLAIPIAMPVEYPLPHQAVPAPLVLRIPPLSVPLKLNRSPHAARESLWVFDEAQVAEFHDLCLNSDERLLRRFETARVESDGRTRQLVRGSTGKKPSPTLPFPSCGFAAHSRTHRVFFPTGCILRPEVRPKQLSALLDLTADRIVWVEPDSCGRPVPSSVSTAAFRPLADQVEYTVPKLQPLASQRTDLDGFSFDRFVLQDELTPTEPVEPMVGTETVARPNSPPTEVIATGWLSRSLDRLAGHFRRTDEPKLASRHDTEDVDQQSRRPKSSARLEQNLTSADSLLHGPDRTARRRELESRLLVEFPMLGSERRAMRWAELGAVYATTSNPADAAICWINAVWEVDAPPLAWLEQWLLAECRAAKLNEPRLTLERILGEPGRFGMVRVLAAYATWAVHSVQPPRELVSDAPQLLGFLEQHFDDLPARAAWLARTSLARFAAGDALGLARWRDRILIRLRERGPGLDLDEPSFLRFHGTASPDRFQIAREWLGRARGPILGWIGKQASSGKLQFAGLDAETECTSAYAQLLLAWGLACLAERTRSRDWAARARKVLTRAAGPGVDPAVHAVLTEALLARIRDAQEGRPAKPGLPVELAGRVESLPEFSRYAVDKFRRFVSILEPIDRVRDYRGKEFREFWGHDRLGERLALLADRSDPPYLNDEARQLLAACSAEPSFEIVPRIAFTLLEVAAHLEPPLLPLLLDQVRPALDGLEAWLNRGRWSETERSAGLPRYQARLVQGAFAAATTGNQLLAARRFVDDLQRRAGVEPSLRTALCRVAGSVFRSVRKLGLRAEGEALLRVLDPLNGAATGDAATLPTRLGLAVGWFAAGDEDAGNRILNEARDRLFLAQTADDRERTELVLAYAEALGFAPTRIALGRLEEIFQRLDRVAHTGSTNRYFTIKPLQLVNAVVRSVVTEEFALGPAVLGWLDDDEFLIRRRIHRDMGDVLREEGMG